MSKRFFEKWKHRQVFLRNNDLNSLIFINKPPCFFGSRGFNILIDLIFRGMKTDFQFSRKSKTTQSNSAAIYFP